MNAGAPSLAVVIAPDTAEEASRLFAALLSGGFHPTIDYGTDADGPRLANFPILVPQPQLREAQAYLRGLRVHAAAPVAGARTPQPPVPEEPPLDQLKQLGQAVGVLAFLLLLTGAIVAVVLVLQMIGRMIA
jgi:hypothetical protein